MELGAAPPRSSSAENAQALASPKLRASAAKFKVPGMCSAVLNGVRGTSNSVAQHLARKCVQGTGDDALRSDAAVRAATLSVWTMSFRPSLTMCCSNTLRDNKRASNSHSLCRAGSPTVARKRSQSCAEMSSHQKA